jgi:hypothetical protein
MKITSPWLTCRFAQLLHVLTQPFTQIFSYSTDLANIPTPPHTHTHTRPTIYLSAHQMPAVASCFLPSKTIFPSSNQITHLPSYTFTCTYSVTHASSRLSLIFPEIRFLIEPTSFHKHRNTAFHSLSRTRAHTHTNSHSITHLSTNVLHRALLPNKQTVRQNKPRLVQYSISNVTDQHPLPQTHALQAPNTHPCESDPIEVYQCLAQVLEAGVKAAELLCRRGASTDVIVWQLCAQKLLSGPRD